MKIIIGADLVPTESNKNFFANGDVVELLGNELLSELSKADFRIFNLEVPLTDIESPIDKFGPNLIAPTDTINGYKAMGADILALANNHILDQGLQGLFSTCKILDDNGIAYVGVGNDSNEAACPYIFECDGKKIGIYACAEHEFSIVSEHAAGANPFDPLESPDHVVELKKKCDFVIVLYHGGKEHYRYPSPNLRKICRKFVEKGADLIVCQHSHCIGCEEKYLSGTIVYGQGNFLFDNQNSEYWQTSLLIQINDDFEITYLPLVKRNHAVRLAVGEEANSILTGFQMRSGQIKKSGFIEKEYIAFSKGGMIDKYLFSLCAPNIFFRIINRLSGYRFAPWFVRKKYNKKRLLAVLNYIECEAHREIIIAALKDGYGGLLKG